MNFGQGFLIGLWLLVGLIGAPNRKISWGWTEWALFGVVIVLPMFFLLAHRGFWPR